MEPYRPHCPRLLFRFPWEVSPRAVLDYYRENRQFLAPWDPPRLPLFYTEERQQSYLGEEADAVAAGQALYWYLTLPEKPEQVIGTVQLTGLTGEPELGYKLSQSQAGKGLGTEAVRAVLELARTPGDPPGDCSGPTRRTTRPGGCWKRRGSSSPEKAKGNCGTVSGCDFR